MKAFDINKSLTFFNNTYDSSSGTPDKAFNGKINRRWETIGEGADGDAVYLECDFGVDTQFDYMFIRGTNIEDIGFQYWTGSTWTTYTPPTTPISSDSGDCYFVDFSTFDYTAYRITGSDTIIADQEKRITEVYTFDLLGSFVIAPFLKVKRLKGQENLVLDNFLMTTINRGSRYEITASLKTNNQVDVDLFNEIVSRNTEFYLWVNDGEESLMIVDQQAFKFCDVIKLANQKGDVPGYDKGRQYSAATNKAKFAEQA